jgi:hypothetical protein
VSPNATSSKSLTTWFPYTPVTGYLIAEIVLITKFELFNIMIYIFALVFLWLSIAASFIFTIWNLRASQFRTARSTYNFMENHDGMVIGWDKTKIGRWSLLFGENTFKRRFG